MGTGIGRSERPPLVVRRVDHLLRQRRPPMLIKGVLAQRGVHILASAPYSGKTFFALEAMRALVYGTPFMGHFACPRAGNVLYLGNDSPAWDISSQFGKLIGLPEPDEDVLGLIAETPLGGFGFILDDSFALTDAADAKRLVEAANGFSSEREGRHYHPEPDEVAFSSRTLRGTSLIVIDTLRSVHGFEEKDNTEMQHVVNLLRYVANETGAAVLALHHFNKSNPGERDRVTLERVRGASALPAGVDAVYALSPKGESIAVRMLKNRPDPLQADFIVNLISSETSARFEMASDVGVVNATALEVIRALLEERRGEYVRTTDMYARLREKMGERADGRKAERLATSVLTALEKGGEIVRVHGAAMMAKGGRDGD